MKKTTEPVDQLNEFEEEGKKKVNVVLHFTLTCLAYLLFGISSCFAMLGGKAGYDVEIVLAVYIGGWVFFLTISATSLKIIKKILYK